MTFENMSENQRRDFWTGYKELLTPLREKGATNMISKEERKRINAYMDLVPVIVKKEAGAWIIDSPDSGPDGFNTKAELMGYIDGELEEIKKVYESNGEIDELRAIYDENGMEV